MTENTNWTSMSDQALAAYIGAFVRHHRLEQNRTQDATAHAAGISRSTLSLLERGQTVTLGTLIQVLRVLDQLQVMDSFAVEQRLSPLALARMQKEKRYRARGKQRNDSTEHEW
ncbi:MAG: XRE family transcriptional regulator [Pelodictyon luteolum]|uniref:XRE family transcriptional regulator n=1 Tax=Pelodictyon luteolum TaxID=1100 RepID=A0A165LQI0_PELLU|nr:helix-turn-helix transcriptional regulator [Pelodictyon luteolum]KZK74304.1 MAG: XRE family transcriptional regulator [Pelodictyon luteolum]